MTQLRFQKTTGEAEFHLYSLGLFCLSITIKLTCAVCMLLLLACLTPCNPRVCSPPGSSAHGLLQARILECAAMPSSRDQVNLSYIFWIPPGKPLNWPKTDQQREKHTNILNKRTTEDEIVGWYHKLYDVNLSKLRELVMDREARSAAVHRLTKSQTRLSNWTKLIFNKYFMWHGKKQRNGTNLPAFILDWTKRDHCKKVT